MSYRTCITFRTWQPFRKSSTADPSRNFATSLRVTKSLDGDTLGRFRHILEKNHLQQQFLEQVVNTLRKKGFILKKGTIVDSTIISSPSSTKNQSKHRDEEAHQTKKGKNWYFGYKAHIGVDSESGLVHSLKVSAANVHDVTMVEELLTGKEKEVYGDSGYLGGERRDEAIIKNVDGEKIKYKMNKRPSQSKNNRARFGYRKTRYKGIKKQEEKISMLCSLANLVIAHRRSLSA